MDAFNEETRFIINPSLRVIRGSDNEIIVRHGSRGRSSQRIVDERERGVLADFVTAFAAGAAYKDVVQQFSGQEVEDIFQGLIDQGVLIECDKSHYAFLVAGLGTKLPEPRVKHLRVIGSGALADAFLKMMEDTLRDTIMITRSENVTMDDEPHMIVCVSDSPNLPLFYDVNELALSYGIRWHAAYVDGPEVIVGPLYVPGMTGCFHDFDVIDEAGRSMRIDYLYGRMGTPVNGDGKLPLFVANMGASYLTASVLQDLFGVGSFLEGYFLRIDLDRMEIIRQKLSRLARCPACMGSRPDIRHPFL